MMTSMKRMRGGESKSSVSSSSSLDQLDGDSWCVTPWCQPSAQHANSISGTSNNGAFTASLPLSAYRQSNAASPTRKEQAAEALTVGERLLASELKHLSIDEREAVYEDIHGVLPQIVETEELLRTSLREFEMALQLLRKGRDGYDKACFLNKAYATSQQLRIMFLRATQYQAKSAVKGLLLHFDIKLKLFGMDKLVRDIVWDDLDENGRECLHKGSIQYVATARRPMLVDVWDQWRYDNLESHARTIWWVVMGAMREVKNNRLLVIGYTLNSSAHQFAKAPGLRKFQLRDALPFHISSFHVCLENSAYRNLFSALMAALPTSIRLRTKFHFGSSLECQYELSSFGIDSNEIIVWTDEDEASRSTSYRARCIRANLNRLQSADYIAPRVVISPDDGVTEIVHYPIAADVLLGRGVPYQIHPGNIALNEYMRRDVQDYVETRNRKTKVNITTTVVHEMQERGSLFLKRENEQWVVVDEETARQRVAMGFRNLSRKL